jgi:DNA-directed RNA polymerase beta subunit
MKQVSSDQQSNDVEKPLILGSKIVGRRGNKGVVSVLKEGEMYQPDLQGNTVPIIIPSTAQILRRMGIDV